ncbi:MAG: hypothetical protein ACRCZ9_08300 [Fusobacteriaceae bacterium]
MKPSKYLDDIAKELIECLSKSLKDVQITAIIETGNFDDAKFDMMRDEEDFSYNKLVGVFPSVHIGYDGYGLINIKKTTMGNYSPQNSNGNTTSFILHDIIHSLPTGRDMIMNKGNTIYNNVVVELDTHFVRRLSELKNDGVDITYHVKKYIVDSIVEINTRGVHLMAEVAKNILADGLNIIEIWDNPATYMMDGAVFQFNRTLDNEKNAFSQNVKFESSGYSTLVKAAIDLFFIWYIDNLVVKGNVSDSKFTEKVVQHLRLAYEKDQFDAFMHISNYVYHETTNRIASGYIDTILERIKYFGSGASLNSQIPPNFKYLPIFNPKKVFDTINGEVTGISDCCTDLHSEALNVDFFDIDKVVHIMALGCVKKDILMAESINRNYQSIPSRDREVLRESSRQSHQCKVEFEFMRDKYSKREAIEKAYDTLDFIDSKRSRMTNDVAINEMNQIEYSLREIIRIASEKDVKAARSEIVVKYPSGYEG